MITEQLIEELKDYLAGPEGCNFRDDENREFRFDCDGTLSKTREWLLQHYPLEWRDGIKFVEERGGFCDCEVVFNVEYAKPPYRPEEER